MSSKFRLPEQKPTLGFKIETIPYTSEGSLAAADYDFSAYDVTVTPEIEEYGRKLAYGDFSRSISISGRRKFLASWKVDMHAGANATTAPQYFQMHKCCAFKETVGAAGVKVVTDATQDRVPATIEVTYREEGATARQLVYRGRGCMGNVKTIYEGGNPVRHEYEFQGVWETLETRAFASIIVPTGFDTALPDPVLSATINFANTTMYIAGFTFDAGNVVEVYSDPTKAEGYDGARVVDRNPTFEMDPDMTVTDDIDHFTRQTDNTANQLVIVIGSMLQMTAPKGQVVDQGKPAVREGHLTNQIRLELKRDVNGNDEFELRQGVV